MPMSFIWYTVTSLLLFLSVSAQSASAATTTAHQKWSVCGIEKPSNCGTPPASVKTIQAAAFRLDLIKLTPVGAGFSTPIACCALKRRGQPLPDHGLTSLLAILGILNFGLVVTSVSALRRRRMLRRRLRRYSPKRTPPKTPQRRLISWIAPLHRHKASPRHRSATA